MAVKIPLTPAQNQSLTVSMIVNGNRLTLGLTFTWNAPGGYWWMVITDQYGNTLIDALPLVCATSVPASNILRQYQYLNIGSAYVIAESTSQAMDTPQFEQLGTDFFLLWDDNSSSSASAAVNVTFS